MLIKQRVIFIIISFYMLLFSIVPLARAENILDLLTKDKSDIEQSGELLVEDAKKRLTELRKQTEKYKKQQHKKKLRAQLKALNSQILLYTKSPKKRHLRKNKKFLKLRIKMVKKTKIALEILNKLQTAYSSMEQSRINLSTVLRSYINAQKSLKEIVTKKFPMKRRKILKGIILHIEERLGQRKRALSKVSKTLKKLNAAIDDNQKALRKARQVMLAKIPTLVPKKKTKKIEEKATTKKTRKQKKLAQLRREKREEKLELKRQLKQIRNVIRRQTFENLTQEAKFLTLRKEEELLQKESHETNIQLYQYTLKITQKVYKHYAAKAEGGLLFYKPFRFYLGLFKEVNDHSKELVKTSFPKTKMFFRETLTRLSQKRLKKGNFLFFFELLLPFFFFLLAYYLRRYLQRPIDYIMGHLTNNKLIQNLQQKLILILNVLRSVFLYLALFLTIYFSLETLSLPEKWNSFVIGFFAILLIVQIAWNLSNRLFAIDAEKRFFTDMADDTAKRLRRVIKLLGFFSVIYLPYLQAIYLLNFPSAFVDIFTIAYFVISLFGLFRAYFKPNRINEMLLDNETKGTEKFLIYRATPFVLILFVGIFGVYLWGYRNFASYLSIGLIASLIIIGITYSLFSLSQQILIWFFGLTNETTPPFNLDKNIASRIFRVAQFITHLLLVTLSLGLLLIVWKAPGGFRALGYIITYPILRVQKEQLSLLSFIEFFLVFGGSVWLSKYVQGLLGRHIYPVLQMQAGAKHATNTIVGYIIIVLGLLLGLHVMGIGLGVLAVFAGVIGIGVGFGLRDIASNFISRLIIIFGRPISVGDVIVVNGMMGKVKEISARSTTIETLDKHIVLVPNANIITSEVENLSLGEPFVRTHIGVGIAYGSDVKLATDTLISIAQAHPKIEKIPVPSVSFSDFADSCLSMKLFFCVKDPLIQKSIGSDLRYEIDEAFRELNIEISFPQQDIHLDPSIQETFHLIKDYIKDIKS